jgi:hypothetical protein
MRPFIRIATSPMGVAVLALAAALLLFLPSCGRDGTGSSAPEIAGCNHVRYQGYTFNLGLFGGGCGGGVASFTQSGSQGGRSYCFDVTCSSGCISGVTVCSASQAQWLGTRLEPMASREAVLLTDAR